MCFKTHLSYLLSKIILLPFKLITKNSTYIHNEPYVIAANHTSFLDGLLLTFIFKGKLAFVIDADLYKYFIIKFFSSFVDFIPYDNDKNNNLFVIRRCIEKLESNLSVVVFPEGKINVDLEELVWKEGAIFISQKSNKKIIPVSIIGANRVWNANSYFPSIGTIKLIIHQPFLPNKDHKISDLYELIYKGV